MTCALSTKSGVNILPVALKHQKVVLVMCITISIQIVFGSGVAGSILLNWKYLLTFSLILDQVISPGWLFSILMFSFWSAQQIVTSKRYIRLLLIQNFNNNLFITIIIMMLKDFG